MGQLLKKLKLVMIDLRDNSEEIERMKEPKNADLREMIKENKLTQDDVAKHLTNQSGRVGTQGKPLNGRGLRKRLDKELTEAQRAEIIEAIEKAIGDNYGIV